MKRIVTFKAAAAVLALSSLAGTAQAQQAVTCGTPMNLLDSGPGAWSLAAAGPQPDRTTPPLATPPVAGYAPAVAATPLDVPPAPPADPDGYRWDPAYSWISINPTGASNPQPYHFYVRQQINIDPSVNLASFALNYDVSVDDQLWAIYINGRQVQAGSPLLAGFGPTDPATSYRTTVPLAVTLNSDWQTGINDIVFAVYDFGGNTGFASRATGMTVNCGPVAPGGSIAAVPVNDWRGLVLMALMMAGASLWRLRRRR